MIKKIYYTWHDIEKAVNDIVSQLYKDGWKPDYVVGISRGGLTPAVLFSHLLDIPMYTLKVSLRDGVEEDCDHNCWMAEDAFGYDMDLQNKPANILIVDDINDGGSTIAWIKRDWPASCLPNSEHWNDVWGKNVRFATVVNNLASKESVSYSSIEINKAEDNCWIVFPWEDWNKPRP
jgi:hypoxanthine phosphoribosyltransferase